jgi:hypothetical protein
LRKTQQKRKRPSARRRTTMMGTAMAAASWPRVSPLEEEASAVMLDAVFDPELVPVGDCLDDDFDEVEGVTVLLTTTLLLLLLVLLPKVSRNPATLLLLVVSPKVSRNGTTDDVVVDNVVDATAVRGVDVVAVPGAVKPKNGVPVKNGLPAIGNSSSRPHEIIWRRRGAAQERCSGLLAQSF